MALSDDDVREILRLIDESDLEELRVETEELSLYVRRGDARPDRAETSRTGPAAKAPPPAPADRAPADVRAERASTNDLVTISAPMIGVFYRAEAPGAPPFVAVGTRVEPDTIVCLIEVMKMMNAIPAGVVGTIAEVCAENAELVEYGAPLFNVRPEL